MMFLGKREESLSTEPTEGDQRGAECEQRTLQFHRQVSTLQTGLMGTQMTKATSCCLMIFCSISLSLSFHE